MKTFSIAAAALLLCATPAAAAYIYTPAAGYETAEGNGNNGVFVRNEQRRLQWRYDDSIFGADRLLINGFSFRFDAPAPDGSGVFDLSDAFYVKLATLDGPLSTTFDENVEDAQTVMSGARKLPFLIGGSAGQTKPFGVHFVFETPYVYDPAAGDLIVEMFTPAQPFFGTFDFVRRHPLQNRVFNQDPTAATGSIQAYGPVTRFDVSPIAVPEPTAWALMILGFGAAGAALRRRAAFANGR